MSIETYTTIITNLYIGLFLLAILMGVVGTWNRIRKKTLKYWWVTPCSILYLIFATFSTIIAFIAYDDPADPNYMRYQNWELHDFVLHDIKTFLIWLFIGALLYFVFERESTKKSVKTGCAVILGFLFLLFVTTIVLSITFAIPNPVSLH